MVKNVKPKETKKTFREIEQHKRRSVERKTLFTTIRQNDKEISVITDKDPQKMSRAEKDAVLIKMWAGDVDNKEIFDKLWTRFCYGVKTKALSYIPDSDEADDIVAETFTRAWENRHKFDGTKGNFSTWLYRICHNLCLTEINNKKKLSTVNVNFEDLYDSSTSNNSSAVAVTIENDYKVNNDGVLEVRDADNIETQIHTIVKEELHHMPVLLRDIVNLKIFKNKKIKEIAIELNISESTVKNVFYNGMKELRQIIKNKHKDLCESFLMVMHNRMEGENF